MAVKKPDEATEPVEPVVVELEQQFEKEQIIKSKKYREDADIIVNSLVSQCQPHLHSAVE